MRLFFVKSGETLGLLANFAKEIWDFNEDYFKLIPLIFFNQYYLIFFLMFSLKKYFLEIQFS